MLKQLTILAIAASLTAALDDLPQGYRAIAKLASPTGGKVEGNITFTQLPDGKVRVTGTVCCLPRGDYGFHVHERGDITGGCLSTGGHFNPEHKLHGHPNDEERHVGDLGNISFNDNGIAELDFVDSQICLSGPHGIIGRGVVLHEKADDFGRSNHPDSKKTGNAGGRVACGVIGILNNAATASVSNIFLLLMQMLSAVALFRY